MKHPLISPRGSKVSSADLKREVEEYFTLGAAVRPGDTVIDVGANIGAFALRAAEMAEDDLTIFCFEPSPDTYQALRANFDGNSVLQKTRHSLNAAGLTSQGQAGKELSFYNFRRYPTNSTFDIAGKRRELEIFFEDRGRRLRERLGPVVGTPVEWVVSRLPSGPLGWWISKQVMGIEEVKARLETLDQVLLREKITRVDLLKIDVEGLELDVLLGLGPQTWPLINQVVMETHNRDGRQAVIEELLKRKGLADLRVASQTSVDNGLESVVLLARRPG
jgi:FkbM family methyltransferase